MTVGLAGLFVVVVASCVNETTYSGTTGPRVAILGDQVVSASAGALHSTLDATEQIRVLGLDGFNSFQMISTAQDVAAGPVPDVVVIETGTKDASIGVSTADTLADIDTLLSLFPSSCAVAVNVNQQITDPAFDATAAQAINAGLGSRYAEVVDWNHRVAADPTGLTGADPHIVPTAAGQQVLANQIKTAVNRCGSRPSSILSNPLPSFGNNFTNGCHAVSSCPTDPNGHPQPSMWGSIEYPYSNHQDGDPFTTRCWGDTLGGSACTNPPVFDNASNTGSHANVIPPNPSPPNGDPQWNPFYRPDGYVYGIKVASAGAVTVQLYDAACTNSGSDTTVESCNLVTPTDFQLYNRSADPNVINADPGNELPGCRQTVAEADPAFRNQWVTLCTFNATAPGVYALRVRNDDIPANPATGFAGCPFTAIQTQDGCHGNGLNSFGIRATAASLAGLQVVPVDVASVANSQAASSSQILTNLEPATAGQFLVVDLYDPADDGTNASVSIVGPNATTGSNSGPPLDVGCSWSRSDTQGGSANLTGTSSPACTIVTHDPNANPFSVFNNEWLRVILRVPTNYTCPPNADNCGWKVVVDGVNGDRNIRLATLRGDIVP